MPTKIKDVYVISDRGENEKSAWSRIGVAFVNLCYAQHKFFYVVFVFMLCSLIN